MKYYIFLIVLFSSCQTKQTIAKDKLEFIPYYILEGSNNGIKVYQHYIFVSGKCEELQDSTLLNYARDYLIALKVDIRGSGITFITDTSSFSKDYDEQHWDRIRLSFCRDFMVDPANATNFNEIGYWNEGKRNKKSLIN